MDKIDLLNLHILHIFLFSPYCPMDKIGLLYRLYCPIDRINKIYFYIFHILHIVLWIK